jgi:hypothetical protein
MRCFLTCDFDILLLRGRSRIVEIPNFLWKTKQDCKYQYHLNCWVLLLLLILCFFLKTILLHNSPKFSLATIPCEPSIIKYLFCISRYYFKHFKPTRHRIYLPLSCCDFDISIYHSLQVLDLLYSIL